MNKKTPPQNILPLAVTSLGLILLLLPAAPAGAQSPDTSGAEDALRILNQYRQSAGMIPFTMDDWLQEAAEGHALYLHLNNTRGHGQDQANTGFTGVTPGERVAAAGYNTTFVWENVSSGESIPAASIDSLFSGIYHRFNFLRENPDEIGVGVISGENSRYVYNLGNSALDSTCSQAGGDVSGSSYTGVCEPDVKVAAADYRSALEGVAAQNPRQIQWPPHGSSGLPPVFFEESPDPLPDYSVSGYPVSINFNDLYVQEAELLAFSLYRSADGEKVETLEPFTAASDPNATLSPLQFALYSRERLEWGTQYRAEARLRVDGQEEVYNWSFVTRDPGVPTHRIEGNGETITATPGSLVVTVLPSSPSGEGAGLSSISWQRSQGMIIEAQFIDINTLLLDVGGSAGMQADFTAGGGESFTVVLADSAESADEASRCAPAAEYQGATGELRVTQVKVDGQHYAAVLNWQEGRFVLESLDGNSRWQTCAPAVFDAATGSLDLPRVEVKVSSEQTDYYEADLQLVAGSSPIAFELTDLQASDP